MMGTMLIHPKFPLIGVFAGLLLGTLIWALAGFRTAEVFWEGFLTPVPWAMIGFISGCIAGLKDRFGS